MEQAFCPGFRFCRRSETAKNQTVTAGARTKRVPFRYFSAKNSLVTAVSQLLGNGGLVQALFIEATKQRPAGPINAGV
jgi:hypothetical protein